MNPHIVIGQSDNDSPGQPRQLCVEFVYPPFGPSALPSLGLAILSAVTKRRGHKCRTHYWNLEMVAEMPFEDPKEQLAAYRTLTERTWHPFNEWIFGAVLFGNSMSTRDDSTVIKLFNRSLEQPDEMLSAESILKLRDGASAMVEAAVNKVAEADIVGISTTFFQSVPGLALAQAVKTRWPSKQVVLGGANCDDEMGATLFRHFGFLDAVFIGESDTTFGAYLDAIAAGSAPDGIPGLLWRDGHGLSRGSAQGSPPVGALDSLPHADYADWVAERERAGLATVSPLVVALESSRGCWWGAKHHCLFCGLNATGMRYRQKTVDRMLVEIEDVVSQTGTEYVYMTDNILSMDYIARLPEWQARTRHQVHFFYEVKSNLRREQLRQLAAAGVTAVQPGIESLSTEALTLMRKGVTAIQNVAFLRSAEELGIRAVWNILVGFPGEDPAWYESIVSRIPLLAHLRPPATVAEVEFHRFSPYHADPGSFGLSLRPLEAYESLYPFDEDVLSRLAYMFQPEDRFERHASRNYLGPLGDAVMAWRTAFYEHNARLVAADDGHDVILTDTRPSYGPRQLRLYGLAATLYRYLSQPRSVRALVAEAERNVNLLPEYDFEALVSVLISRPHELPVVFRLEEFLRDAESHMALLVELGVLYEERGPHQSQYLALGLSESSPSVGDVWAGTGV